jgi:lycopene cyclase domain-containing protein
MELRNFTYLFILLGTIIVPLSLSFEKELRFYTRLKYLMPAILITAAMFVYWDIGFVKAGIWSFNSRYTVGIKLINLPIEEWLFFIIVPYALTFINEVLRIKIREWIHPPVFVFFSFALLVFCALVAWFNHTRLYTFNNFLFLAVFLGYVVIRNIYKDNFYWFYATWLLSLIPFLIVNGLLTYLPVVEYNPEHILGIRILTIPVEDFAYCFLLYLMTDVIYRFLEERRFY